jgi:ankyrin repeat protein
MIACLNGNLPIMKMLLELALNEEEQLTMANQSNRKNMTALHISCLIGNISMCASLLQCGADFLKADL